MPSHGKDSFEAAGLAGSTIFETNLDALVFISQDNRYRAGWRDLLRDPSVVF